ncbi:hypothetical protein LO772_26445 [Yinghuangia sp. ASG 101]|uniref:hypothetical protein n=1 Tax=Yinghuangia sp. ASG 101 TaxID=2896848 RepID=UPI001E416B51|nr:hypothetical protein [Yinghuangia sp. ASG 101]UGQ10374.1 hypothetical protein LO772_26445 [Yinghuangia sp. ASG 101]
MGRPPDWSALPPGTDPTPGDPLQIDSLGQAFTALAGRAATIHQQIDSMRTDGVIQEWVGFSAQAYKEHIDPVPPDIAKLRDSYQTAGDALIAYATALTTAQGIADRALTAAQTARSDKTKAESAKTTADAWVTRATTHLDKLENHQTHNIPEPTPAELAAARQDKSNAIAAQTRAGTAVTAATNALNGAITNRATAVLDRDTAATALVTKLRDASDQGMQNLNWFERAADWFYDNVVPWLKVAVAVLGVIALFVSGPLGWIVFALAAVVLVSTVVQYARGKAGLGDVFMALLDVLPGMKNLTLLAKNAKWVTKAASGLTTAGRAVRSSKAAFAVKPVAWAGRTTKNAVSAFGRNGKVMRGYNGKWATAPTTRAGKVKVAATKYGMQYATNVGAKYATTLSANYLNGKEVRLWDPAAFVNAAAGAVVSVGGKGVGDKIKNRLATGRWKSTEPGRNGTPRNAENPDRKGTERPASRRTEERHRDQERIHRDAETRHDNQAADSRNNARTHEQHADSANNRAQGHEQNAQQHRSEAETHRQDAKTATDEASAANHRADQHEAQRAEHQRTADEHRGAEQTHRDAADTHTKDADRHDATAQNRTADADRHAQTAHDRGQDAQTHRDTAAGHRDDAQTHRDTADRHHDRADAHDAKAREHDARADRDPANAQQHRDAAAHERDAAVHERSQADTHTAKADDADVRARDADTRATKADDDVRTARDAETQAREDARQARDDARTSRDGAATETAHADQARNDADTAQAKADDARTARDTARTEAAHAETAATKADDAATQSAAKADKADEDAAVARKEAQDSRDAQRTAERDAERSEARRDDAAARAEGHKNRADGKDADGGLRYQKPYHRLLDTTADTVSFRRHWYTGGLNSMLSSMVGKTAENVYLMNAQNTPMTAGSFAMSVGMSGAGGFAGGAMQQVATKWQVHNPAFTGPGLHNQPGDHMFQLRPDKPGWQYERTIEIATKRVGKLMPEANILARDLWTNATDWPLSPTP